MKIKFQLNKNYKSYRIIIFICVFMYLIKEFLIYKTGDSNSVLLFLGADYKTFTLGFYEFFRLITCTFLHSNILHLACNMYTLFVLGNFLEYIYGTKKFLLFLFLGVLFGSLTFGILNANSISIGISGGLYALITIMFLDLILFKRLNITNFIITIGINLALNFMPGVAWQAHLGGVFAGVILFFAEYNNKIDDKNKYIALYITIILCLILMFTKYISTKKDIENYLGTDLKYVTFLKEDMKLNRLSDYYSDKIYKYYLEGTK